MFAVGDVTEMRAMVVVTKKVKVNEKLMDRPIGEVKSKLLVGRRWMRLADERRMFGSMAVGREQCYT